MMENFGEKSFLDYKNEESVESEELNKLSREEILKLVENKTYPDKKEVLEKLNKEYYWPEGVDWEAVESKDTYVKDVYIKVGSVNIQNKITGGDVELDVCCGREEEHYDDVDPSQPEKYDSNLATFGYDYVLIDKSGVIVAMMKLRDYNQNILRLENVSEKDTDLSKNLLNYNGDISEEPKSFTYIDKIFVSKKYVTNEGKIMPFPYEGCGRSLHEVAVEHSIRSGFDGRIQLYAAAIGNHSDVESAGFHENFGYCYKDVLEKDGKLHHKGQEIHQALAESRWEEAQKWKKDHPEEKIATNIRDNYRPHSSMALYAYLPEEVVIREKERMLKHQNLQMNLETLEATEKKRVEINQG